MVKKILKKSVIAQIIFTFILITIAVNVGVFLVNTIEKNKELIKRSEFPYFDKVSIFVEHQLQDPEYFRFFIITNSPLQVTVFFYNIENNIKINKTYFVDGYLEVVENLSSLFPVNLDNTNLVLYYKVKGSSLLKGPSVHLKNANKILIVNTNVPSLLQTNFLTELKPGKNVFYIYNDLNSVTWYNPFQFLKINLNNQKIENLDLVEDFNLRQFTLSFEDDNGNPAINVKVYINNFEVGVTDSNGELIVSYHRNKRGYVKIEDRCYYFSDLVRFRRSVIRLSVSNLC